MAQVWIKKVGVDNFVYIGDTLEIDITLTDKTKAMIFKDVEATFIGDNVMLESFTMKDMTKGQ